VRNRRAGAPGRLPLRPGYSRHRAYGDRGRGSGPACHLPAVGVGTGHCCTCNISGRHIDVVIHPARRDSATMEQVDLSRYAATGILGIGADYEARAAVERATGRQVVLKRPAPEIVRRRQHAGIEARTDRMLQAYQEVGHTIPTVVPIVGYTERANHDAYFGE